MEDVKGVKCAKINIFHFFFQFCERVTHLQSRDTRIVYLLKVAKWPYLTTCEVYAIFVIFNFNKFVAVLDATSFVNDPTTVPCSCENSPYRDPY